MKKFILLLTCFAIFLTYYSQAQVYKGLKTIGGSGSISYDTDDEIFGIGLFPSYGVFTSDHLLVEGNLGFSYFSSNFSNSFTSLSIGPSARYYFSPKAQQSLFFNAGAGFLVRSFGESDTGYELNIGPGMAFFLNENISIDLGLQYSRNDLGNFKDNHVGLTVGFKIFLGKKKEE